VVVGLVRLYDEVMVFGFVLSFLVWTKWTVGQMRHCVAILFDEHGVAVSCLRDLYS